MTEPNRIELNEAQRRAVMHGSGSAVCSPLLVIAGAGSGKTNTLAHRVAHVVSEGADPARLLLLTFSRRAAQELERRAGRVLAAKRKQHTSDAGRASNIKELGQRPNSFSFVCCAINVASTAASLWPAGRMMRELTQAHDRQASGCGWASLDATSGVVLTGGFCSALAGSEDFLHNTISLNQFTRIAVYARCHVSFDSP